MLNEKLNFVNKNIKTIMFMLRFKEGSESPTFYEDLKSMPNSKKILQKKNQLHPLFGKFVAYLVILYFYARSKI